MLGTSIVVELVLRLRDCTVALTGWLILTGWNTAVLGDDNVVFGALCNKDCWAVMSQDENVVSNLPVLSWVAVRGDWSRLLPLTNSEG
eukprot:15342787-Ditylum_brightwellii.AAC.1